MTRRAEQKAEKATTNAKFEGLKTLIHREVMRRCFDGELFEENRKKLRRQHPACAVCHRAFYRRFQVDHIIPLGIFRAIQACGIKFIAQPDGLENLQLLCKKCHKIKTKRDKAAIYALKKELKPWLIPQMVL